MKIEFKGAEKLAKKLNEVATKYPRERDMFLRMESEKLKGATKALTPVDTGYLRNSWQSTEPAGGSVEVYNNAQYALTA